MSGLTVIRRASLFAHLRDIRYTDLGCAHWMTMPASGLSPAMR